MKLIIEYVNETKNDENINESFGGFAIVATEIALLSWAVGMFIKSVKELAEGENGIIEIVRELIKDAKINKLCKKLAKDDEVKEFLSSKDNVRKDAFMVLVKSKLSEKDAAYFIQITKDKVEEFVK